MTDLLSRKSRRYVVMPFSVDTSTGRVVRTYGIRDMMMCRYERSWQPIPPGLVWCQLPDENGELKPLVFETEADARGWLADCRAIRIRLGGPAWWMPSGWYDANPMTRARVRVYADPWADLEPYDPALAV